MDFLTLFNILLGPPYFQIFLLALTIFLSGYVARKIKFSKNSSTLLSSFMKGEVFNSMQMITPDNNAVLSVMVTDNPNLYNVKSHTLYMVSLPFPTTAHLVGIPTKYRVFPPDPERDHMEPIVLEGDYPNYFQLFTDTGQQSESRYALDPKAMLFTVEFCSNYWWEIHDNTLYFVSQVGAPSLEVIDQFIKEIKPAIESKVKIVEKPEKLSYTHRKAKPLNCPICSDQLIDGGPFLECPNGHGLLMSGKSLAGIRQYTLSQISSMISVPSKNPDSRPAKLTCPYCSSEMKTSQFQTLDITLDLCNKCGYRWLDTGELEHIIAPHIKRNTAS